MKRSTVIAGALSAALLLAWLGLRMASSPARSGSLSPLQPNAVVPPPTSTNTDPVQVFQRAFWKRPTGKDQILHAERREWVAGDGLERWQWFIAVDPSDELARYLHEQNPFSLSEPKGKVTLPEEPRPSWFPSSADGFTVRQSIDGQMLFLTQVDTGRLFATSQGHGFAKPVEISPSHSPAALNSATAGRLPTTPPPNPNQP